MSAWTMTEEEAIWRAYCRGIRGCQILPVNGDTPEADAAMGLGAIHAKLAGECDLSGQPRYPLTRPALLAEVARLCGEQGDVPPLGYTDEVGEALIRADERGKVLDALTAWWTDGGGDLPGWMASQRKAGAS